MEAIMQENQEKNVEIKTQRDCRKDQLSSIFWGILLIYLGVLFFLVEFDILYSDEWFAFFIFGLGVLMVGDYLLRHFSESLRTASMAKLIFGILFIVLSANHLFYLNEWWPLLLVAVGLLMVWSSFRKREARVNLSSN
jgi:hypothetical protein